MARVVQERWHGANRPIMRLELPLPRIRVTNSLAFAVDAVAGVKAQDEGGKCQQIDPRLRWALKLLYIDRRYVIAKIDTRRLGQRVTPPQVKVWWQSLVIRVNSSAVGFYRVRGSKISCPDNP